jgi:hypothetical protein
MIIDSDCKQLPPQPPPAELVDTSDPLPPDESLPGVIEVSYCFCWRVLLSLLCVCFGGGGQFGEPRCSGMSSSPSGLCSCSCNSMWGTSNPLPPDESLPGLIKVRVQVLGDCDASQRQYCSAWCGRCDACDTSSIKPCNNDSLLPPPHLFTYTAQYCAPCIVQYCVPSAYDFTSAALQLCVCRHTV